MHLKFSYYSILNFCTYIYAFYLIMTAFMVTIYSKTKMIRKNVSLKLFKNKLGKYISMQPIYLQYNINIFLWLLLKLFPNPSCRSFISLHWILAANIFFWHIFFWDAVWKMHFWKKVWRNWYKRTELDGPIGTYHVFFSQKPPLIYIFATFKSTFFSSAFCILFLLQLLSCWTKGDCKNESDLERKGSTSSTFPPFFPTIISCCN